MFCQQCGAQVDDDAAFCIQCGNKMENTSVLAATATPEEVKTEEQVEVSTVKDESTVVAPTPVASTPVAPTPVAPTPVAPTPVAPTPVAPTPVAPTPVAPTPVAPTPVASTPVAPTPVAPQATTAPITAAVNPTEQPMTILGWIGTMIVMMIPVVNIVMFFVWAFGSNSNKSKKTYFQASLILFLVFVVLTIIFGATVYAILAPLIQDATGTLY